MFEQNHFARHVYVIVIGIAGPLHELPEKRVVNDVGADEIATPGLAYVDWMEVSGDGGGVIVGGDGVDARTVLFAE